MKYLAIPFELEDILQSLRKKGARSILVGGAVRDAILGLPSKDFDIEVYGLTCIETLVSVLKRFGRVHEVGKSFGVIKLRTDTYEYDFSFPRTEIKTGKGHKGFIVSPEGKLDFVTAFKRRDFTINAIGYDPIEDEIIDIYEGVNDLKKGILRHIDDATFIEDPLRVYRAVQFAARFHLTVEEKTQRLCRHMVKNGMLDELPKERVFEEVNKLLLKASTPSKGFELMRAWGITERYFPELHALAGVMQDTTYHPEGDVWTHTMMSLDAMASIWREEGMTDKKEILCLMYAILCHDLGKPDTTTLEYADGTVRRWKENPRSDMTEVVRIRSLGHEEKGVELAFKLMARVTNEKNLMECVANLVRHHMKPAQFYRNKAKAGAIRRLSLHVDIPALVRVAKADAWGRTTPQAKEKRFEAGTWLLEKAREVGAGREELKPLVRGKDLIALGLKPSKRFKEILDVVYEKQLDGEFSSKAEAVKFMREYLKLS